MKRVIILILVLLLSLNCVLALGVSSPYWKDKPLKMYPGEVKDITFTLVNKPTGETEKAFVAMEDDAGIAEITSGSEYFVEPGTVNTKVRLKISIPESASVGDNYKVMFSVKGASPSSSGMVQLSVGYNVDFPVEVVPEVEVPPNQIPDEVIPQIEEGISTGVIFGIIVAILVVVLIILFLILKRRK
ncbi:MAG: hypothetical protein ABIB79_03700 [archaeon]